VSAWLDLEASPQAEAILCGLDVPVADLPVVIIPGGPLLRNPAGRALLDALGMSGAEDRYPARACDLLVVGGGPAGLAASVYGASEGAGHDPGWLAGQLAEDGHGFLLTGADIPAVRLDDERTTPLFLETSRPGIFAVGDVRGGSVKRAAAAIGQGSMAVRLIFDRLQSARAPDVIEPGTGSPRV
jgi:thioredoxin reductase